MIEVEIYFIALTNLNTLTLLPMHCARLILRNLLKAITESPKLYERS